MNVRRARAFGERAAARATGSILEQLPDRPAIAFQRPGGARAGSGGRWGLVLGGGGVLGGTWLIAALDALERTRGIDARDAELIVGTSAGSVVGALLAAGVSIADQRGQQERSRSGPRVPVADGPLAGVAVDVDTMAVAVPPLPRLRPGGTALLKANRGSLHRLPKSTLLAGFAPTGRGALTEVRGLIDAAVTPGAWAPHAGYRAVTLDYASGRRTVFGAPGAPVAALSDAVVASCSIPGWFQPVSIDGRQYVDGGTWSSSNADLLAGAGLDEVFVLAPMVSLLFDSPLDWRSRMERRVRIRATRRALSESRLLRASGTSVTVFGPGPRELALIGHNLMAVDHRRELLGCTFATATEVLADPYVVEAEPIGPGLEALDNASDLLHPLIDGQLQDPLDRIAAAEQQVPVGAALGVPVDADVSDLAHPLPQDG
jgi:NTE family protein